MSGPTSTAPADATPAPSDQVRPFRRIGLLRLTWPLLVVTLLTLLAALGNVVILSAASPELNAAVATANQILGVLYDISVLFSIGGLVVISQLLGAGLLGRARRATRTTLRASTLLGLGIGVAVAVGGPLVVLAIDTPPEIVSSANAYLWVAAGGMVFNAYIVAATAVLRAYGRTALLLVLAVLVNLLDVALLTLFVLVLELGPVGAALPSLLVGAAGALLLSWFVRRTTGVSVFTRVGTTEDAPPGGPGAPGGPGNGAGRMARLSLPSVIENGLYNLAIVVTVSFINALGTNAINARSYALTLTALVTGLVLAVAQGNETVVGWDVGERERLATRRRTLRTIGWTALGAAVLSAVLWLGAAPALSVFGASQAVVADATTLLGLSILLLPLSAVSQVLYGALRSAGDVVVPMVYSIVASVAVLLPLSWLLVQVAGLGLAGAWWALIAAEAIKAVLLLSRWIGGRWQRIPSVADGA